MRLETWIRRNTAIGEFTVAAASVWLKKNCKFAAINPSQKKLPKRISVPGFDGYIMVDNGRSGQNPDGSWSISGNLYTEQGSKPVYNLEERPENISIYDGPHSPVFLEEQKAVEERRQEGERARLEEEERKRQQESQGQEAQFLAAHGLTRRKVDRDWAIHNVPNLNLDALRDPRTKEQTLRVLGEQTGRQFSDDELEQIAKLYIYDNDVVKVRELDPQAGTATIFSPVLGEDDAETISMNVLQGFGQPYLPKLPQSASEQQRRRTGKSTKPYRGEPEFKQSGELSREMMSRMTPNLQQYLPNVRLKGEVYENYGLQRYNEPLGERFFMNEIQLFGLNPDEFPEETMDVNPARALSGDEPLRGAWSGYVTLQPDATGRVPAQVLKEALEIASDSRPQIQARSRFIPIDRDELWGAYKRGPVYFSSNNLFRHLVGLGYYGNTWFESEGMVVPPEAAAAG